jgi:hypothetical protein
MSTTDFCGTTSIEYRKRFLGGSFVDIENIDLSADGVEGNRNVPIGPYDCSCNTPVAFLKTMVPSLASYYASLGGNFGYTNFNYVVIIDEFYYLMSLGMYPYSCSGAISGLTPYPIISSMTDSWTIDISRCCNGVGCGSGVPVPGCCNCCSINTNPTYTLRSKQNYKREWRCP